MSKTNKTTYDVIVIGSGFGGAVSAYRMAEKGYSVCLIERGKQYGMHAFPRRIHEIKKDFFWDPEDKQFGIMEFCDYQQSDAMSVAASGLGGGSLIYANVLMKMPPQFFTKWPGKLTREQLDPYYNKVLAMMEASPYPFDSDPYYNDTPKTAHMQKIAQQLSPAPDATAKPKFIFPHLAVNFKGDFPGAQITNKHGAIQSKCNKCGECDIGCNIHAKNTLDLNYIFAAQQKFGLTVLTETLATTIIPQTTGYNVTIKNTQTHLQQTLTASKVFICAGTLGTNKLLLKMKKDGHLNQLSSQLGKKYCSNGDLEGSVFNCSDDLLVSKGPVITGAIEYQYTPYPDGFAHGAFIQDAGLPVGLIWYLAGKLPAPRSLLSIFKISWLMIVNFIAHFLHIRIKTEVNIGNMVADIFDRDTFSRKTFLLLGMGRDRSTGEIVLNEKEEPIIKWPMKDNELHFNRVRHEMRQIADKLNGTFIDNPLTHLNKIIAVHPLGGCSMADNIAEGVVNTRGEVFNYPGLYVADGSILPTSTGPNPSLTIAALAEYIADQIN